MRVLTPADASAAVTGGAILGGGGGGHISKGAELAEAALRTGEVRMLTVGELPPDALVAICAGVGAPGAVEAELADADFAASLRHLNAELARRGGGTISALATNENGAMGTVNGWLQAASTGLPLLDCPCNGRAHPTAVMGSLGLHRDPTYTSLAGFAGGPGLLRSEGVVAGSLETTSRAMRALSVISGGMIAVTRNPVRADFLAERGAPGAIAQAIAVGNAHAEGGVEAVARLLGGRILGQGTAVNLAIDQKAGFDVGHLEVGGTRLTFVNEYMRATADGVELAHFPDLLMTFDAGSGEPVVSARLAEGQDLILLAAPRASLMLSATMDMPELMEPIAALLAGEMINAG